MTAPRKARVARSDVPRVLARMTQAGQREWERSVDRRLIARLQGYERELDAIMVAVPRWSEDYWRLVREMDRTRCDLLTALRRVMS